MELTNKQTQRLQDLYYKKYKIQLTKGQAIQLGTKLINLFKPVILPESKEVGKI